MWEKNPGFDVKSSGATILTQSIAALWKMNNFDDVLLTTGIGIAASMSTHTQLKFEVLDTYKNLPPLATIQKNDVAVLMSIVYKN